MLLLGVFGLILLVTLLRKGTDGMCANCGFQPIQLCEG